jgi:hypothetical protein
MGAVGGFEGQAVIIPCPAAQGQVLCDGAPFLICKRGRLTVYPPGCQKACTQLVLNKYEKAHLLSSRGLESEGFWDSEEKCSPWQLSPPTRRALFQR